MGSSVGKIIIPPQWGRRPLYGVLFPPPNGGMRGEGPACAFVWRSERHASGWPYASSWNMEGARPILYASRTGEEFKRSALLRNRKAIACLIEGVKNDHWYLETWYLET